MISLDVLANDKDIQEEYKKAVLLTFFKKMCVQMNNDTTYKQKVQTLYRQTHDKIMTTRILIEKKFNVSLDDNEASLVNAWITAYLTKTSQRNSKFTNINVKKELFKKQNGLCASCGEKLGDDWAKIHVDHIIPFVLVGDMLLDNYQDLCETCNECKSSKVNFIIGKKLKIF